MLLNMAAKVTVRHPWNILFFRLGRWLPFLEYTHMIPRITNDIVSGAMFHLTLIYLPFPTFPPLYKAPLPFPFSQRIQGVIIS